MNSDDKISKYLMEKGYKLGPTFAEGAYCKVKVSYYNNKGVTKKIACKIINKEIASREFVDKFLPRELAIVQNIRHANIVNVQKIHESKTRVYMFMDLCEKGDLLDHIKDKGALTESCARTYFRQLVSAVDYLHSLNISHRDLKCENILLDVNDRIKITDFGFARSCTDNRGMRVLSSTFCGSAAYAAPEILLGKSYNPKMYDVWSLGCVLFIMLTATMPFDDSDLRSMLECQLRKNICFPRVGTKISSSAKKLVLHLLEPDITRRATIRQVIKNNWLNLNN